MGKNIQEIAKIAAEWWVDKISDPKFDNGDNSSTGFLGMALASMLVEPVINDSKDKFILYLSKLIEHDLEERDNIILDVDYHPCKNLRDASEYANISNNNFPCKTVMWIDKNHISVRYGYRAEEEFLYSNKLFWKKRIDSSKETIKYYNESNYCSWIKNENERQETVKELILNQEELMKEYEINLEKTIDL
ncbi:MAG TPA: hypothetical protein VIK86_04650 [Candidatus Paceibacterota bacterium]